MSEDLTVLSNMDKKEVEFTLGTSEQYLEFTLGQVHTLAKFNLMVDATVGGAAMGTDILNIVKNIYVCPNGMIPAINISGEEATEIMKQKLVGTNEIVSANAADSHIYKKLFSFDFRDFDGAFALGLPEEAKDLSVKITLGTLTDYIAGATSGTVKLTVQLIQDESLNESIGYRRYFTETIGVDVKDSNKVKKIPLPRFGFLDSITILGNGNVPIGEIQVSKNDIEFPLKTLWDMEKLKSKLVHADFDPETAYLNMIRPINADAARTLYLELTLGAIASAENFRLVYEYIYILS